MKKKEWFVAFAGGIVGITIFAIIAGGSDNKQSAPRGWDNDRVVEETKKCEAAGMRAQVIQNLFTYSITKVNCVPKEWK